jgi:hypothetical protein
LPVELELLRSLLRFLGRGRLLEETMKLTKQGLLVATTAAGLVLGAAAAYAQTDKGSGAKAPTGAPAQGEAQTGGATDPQKMDKGGGSGQGSAPTTPQTQSKAPDAPAKGGQPVQDGAQPGGTADLLGKDKMKGSGAAPTAAAPSTPETQGKAPNAPVKGGEPIQGGAQTGGGAETKSK